MHRVIGNGLLTYKNITATSLTIKEEDQQYKETGN